MTDPRRHAGSGIEDLSLSYAADPPPTSPSIAGLLYPHRRRQREIRLPNSGVTTSLTAPGVLSNTAVVAPAGVVDIDTSNDTAGPVEAAPNHALYLPLLLRSAE